MEYIYCVSFALTKCVLYVCKVCYQKTFISYKVLVVGGPNQNQRKTFFTELCHQYAYMQKWESFLYIYIILISSSSGRVSISHVFFFFFYIKSYNIVFIYRINKIGFFLFFSSLMRTKSGANYFSGS